MLKLKRAPINFPEITEATLNKHAAEQAAKWLGYSFGDRRNREVRTKLDRRDTLVRVQELLKRLSIVPLDEKRVSDYQVAMRTQRARKTRNPHRWRDYEVSEYTAEIPAFALVRAAQVARRMQLSMPEVKRLFGVSELVRIRRKQRIPDPDPFLYLEVLGQRFYLDVWNEPNFEGRRTV